MLRTAADDLIDFVIIAAFTIALVGFLVGSL